MDYGHFITLLIFELFPVLRFVYFFWMKRRKNVDKAFLKCYPETTSCMTDGRGAPHGSTAERADRLGTAYGRVGFF